MLQIYKVYMPIILVALLFGSLAVVFQNYFSILTVFLGSECLNLSLTAVAKRRLFISLPSINIIMYSIHFGLLGLPLYLSTIVMFCTACYERFWKKRVYRYNYQNLQSALQNFNVNPPY